MEMIPTTFGASPHATGSSEHHSPNPQMSPDNRNARWRLLLFGAVVTVIGLGIGILVAFIPNPIAARAAAEAFNHKAEQQDSVSIPIVKVVHAKPENSAEIILERMATIEPYYRADLRARASGIVNVVHYDIGDNVKRGEVLIEIDVPESEQDVAQKKALIIQRQKELKVSEARLKDAEALIGVSTAAISQREADVQGFTATRDLKKRRFDRYQDLASRGSVVGSVVEEEERDYLASEATLLAAAANVTRASRSCGSSQ